MNPQEIFDIIDRERKQLVKQLLGTRGPIQAKIDILDTIERHLKTGITKEQEKLRDATTKKSD